MVSPITLPARRKDGATLLHGIWFNLVFIMHSGFSAPILLLKEVD